VAERRGHNGVLEELSVAVLLAVTPDNTSLKEEKSIIFTDKNQAVED